MLLLFKCSRELVCALLNWDVSINITHVQGKRQQNTISFLHQYNKLCIKYSLFQIRPFWATVSCVTWTDIICQRLQLSKLSTTHQILNRVLTECRTRSHISLSTEAGSTSGRITWKVTRRDGSFCRMDFCHITGVVINLFECIIFVLTL